MEETLNETANQEHIDALLELINSGQYFELLDNDNEISPFCHESRDPVFITQNGQGDLAVISIETFEVLNGKLELYRLLDEGREAVKAGTKRPLQQVMKDIKRGIENGELQG